MIYPLQGKQNTHRFAAHLIALVLLWSLSCLARAQNPYGAIIGTITDPSGAVVPNATVTVTNLGTNDSRTAQSTSKGEYRFLDLPPANYRLSIEAPSFKRFVVESASVQVDGALRVDAPMQIGGSTETVVVTTDQPLLQTDSGTLGYEVEGKEVQEMPLNGRNVLNLIALVPGVVPQGASEGAAGQNQLSHTNNIGFGNYQISGGIAGQSGEYLDGAPINGLGGNVVELVPTQDTIQEFRVATNAVSPEFGRFAGGVIELATKSGGNGFHGSAYEYFRNNIFNANNFFSKEAGLPRGKYNQDQYGTVISGPIKKDRAFFFGSWEGFRSLLGIANPTNVPTQAMQDGVFTKAIVDPTGRCSIVHDATAGTWTVPQSCWDPTAKVLKNYFPLPLTANSSINNYYVSPLTGSVANQYTGRVDYNITPKQRFFGKYTYWRLKDLSTNELGSANGFQTGNAFSSTAAHQAVLGNTYTINQNLIADVRVSYLRSFFNLVPPSLGVDQAQFGPAFAALAPFTSAHVLPEPGLNGPDGIYNFFPTDILGNDRWNTYALSANVIKVLNRHTFKFGGDARLMQRSGYGTVFNASGRFNFSNTTTSDGTPNSGDEFASFLLGEFQSGGLTTFQLTDTFNYSQGLFVTDTWQLSRGLTLNLGVRWELPGGLEENHDRGTELLPNTLDPSTGVVGTLALLNSSLYPSRSFEPIRHNLFSPRLGLAQSVGKQSVFRIGYGIVYLPPDLPTGVVAYNSPVNVATTGVVNAGAVPTVFLSNPFPNGILQPVGRSDPAFMKSFLGQTISGAEPNEPYPVMQQWNVTWDQELSDKLTLQFGYVGSKGTHLPELAPDSIDELSSQYYSLGSALLQPSAANSSMTLGQSLRPYPQYQGVLNSADYSGSSTYNSLQMQGRMRFHGGSVLTGNYTWSKFLTDTDSLNGSVEQSGISGVLGSFQDFNNKAGERSLSSFDVRHRGLINYVLSLPFGKGQRFGGNVSGIADKVISGWGVNGITTFQTGFPLAFSYGPGNYLTQQFGAGTLRPNYTPGCPKQVSGSAYDRVKRGEWFNAACFTYPGDFAFGNEPRVDPTLRAQGIANYDFAAVKSTTIHDQINAQFRMEFFNIFNHPQFSNPGIAENGGNYNQVITQLNQPRLIQASLRINF